MAPETLLVFEVAAPIDRLIEAARKISGLDVVGEEEWAADDGTTATAYLLFPDHFALKQVASLWARWQKGEDFEGFAPWRNLFSLLKDIRRWGPRDRVREEDRSVLAKELEAAEQEGRPLRLEIDLVYTRSGSQTQPNLPSAKEALAFHGAKIVSQTVIHAIEYIGLLADIPVAEAHKILNLENESIAGIDTIQCIRPQSLTTTIDVPDGEPAPSQTKPLPQKPPVLALLDGALVSQHPFLKDRVAIEDVFGLDDEALTTLKQRVHGTSMASLIIHGDLNETKAQPLPRRICSVPIMQWDGGDERTPQDRLVTDLVYQAVQHLIDLDDADITIINLSMGNARAPFHGRMSPWARLLDWLAWEHGLLFVVSAGNQKQMFLVPGYTTTMDVENARADERAGNILQGLENENADRRLISPAETVNGLTVGAQHRDWITPGSGTASLNINPYPWDDMVNPSSRQGPGFARSVKPDILMAGGREHLRMISNSEGMCASPIQASRFFGLKVAAPPNGADLNRQSYTLGTSAATALASRTAHRIHDALEDAYGDLFMGLPRRQRALVLKALVVHPAAWNPEVSKFIKSVLGPEDKSLHVKQKDNIRRYLGYGTVDPDTAVACAADRATFWATGEIQSEQAMAVDIPIPACMGGKALPHSLSATLAWFAPIRPGRKLYRSVRLKIQEPEDTAARSLRVKADSAQPDHNQINRGTTISRWWSGDRAPVVTPNMTIPLTIQREPDQPGFEDEAVPFGLAVTLQMPGVVELYQEVQLRLPVATRVR